MISCHSNVNSRKAFSTKIKLNEKASSKEPEKKAHLLRFQFVNISAVSFLFGPY